MLLVDSSVWIDYFNGRQKRETDLLDSLLKSQPVIAGDLIVVEVLQEFRREKDFAAAREAFANLSVVSLCNPQLAVKAAQYVRFLRKRGVQARKTIDSIIATFCIVNHVPLLHSDKDFVPYEKYLGLSVL